MENKNNTSAGYAASGRFFTEIPFLKINKLGSLYFTSSVSFAKIEETSFRDRNYIRDLQTDTTGNITKWKIGGGITIDLEQILKIKNLLLNIDSNVFILNVKSNSQRFQIENAENTLGIQSIDRTRQQMAMKNNLSLTYSFESNKRILNSLSIDTGISQNLELRLSKPIPYISIKADLFDTSKKPTSN